MMFGTREPFEYLECGQCGTLQLIDVPDLARHYPIEYFSFDTTRENILGTSLRRRVAVRLAGMRLVKGRGLLGKIVLDMRPSIEDEFPRSLLDRSLGLNFRSRILDFGCGAGHLLHALRYFGFRDLTGADLFIETELNFPGVNIYKKGLEDLQSAFDLIMLHHSFEHLADPEGALRELHRLLADNGNIVIRMPVVSRAWKHYRTDWVQLDPPRHLFLYTEHAFRELAERSGFIVEKVVYDSTAFQFWGSEQYRMDMPLNDPRSLNRPDGKTVFSEEQQEAWRRDAERLNKTGEGDQACFYLRKSTPDTT